MSETWIGSVDRPQAQIVEARLILVDEYRGRLDAQRATLGFDRGIPLEETRHRDLYTSQVRPGVGESRTLQTCLVHLHLDSVDAAQEQFGGKVRGDLDVGLRRCPECRLQPPCEQALDRERKHQIEEESYQNQYDQQSPPTASQGAGAPEVPPADLSRWWRWRRHWSICLPGGNPRHPMNRHSAVRTELIFRPQLVSAVATVPL